MHVGKAEGGGCSPECASSTTCTMQKGSSIWDQGAPGMQ